MIRAITLFFFALILTVIYQANSQYQGFYLELVRQTPYGDKVGHFMLFGTLTLLTNFAFPGRLYIFKRLKLPMGTILVSLFVILEEISQIWIPARTFDGFDLLADFLGICIFTIASILILSQKLSFEK